MSKRLVFEEVGAGPKSFSTEHKPTSGAPKSRTRVQIWLLILLILTALTVVIGGLTRLTDSGLSITEWEPLQGVVPPFSETVWQSEFERYQQTTEFKVQNSDMDLAEFKFIYWWEWGHRQLGRLVGLTWAIGFAWFAIGKQLTARRLKRLLAIGVLIGVQGVIGWWMVASGLTDDALDVAPYRLAIHLTLAFVIAGLTFWEILLLSRQQHLLFQARRFREPRLENAAAGFISLILLQVIAGALMAGNDAGMAFPTWPLMSGEFLPSNSFDLQPWWTNFIANVALVHFNHRILGYLTVLFAVILWFLGRRSGNHRTRLAFAMLLAVVVIQTALGILTAQRLLSTEVSSGQVLFDLQGAVNLVLAIFHQIGALILFHAAIWARFNARYPQQQIR